MDETTASSSSTFDKVKNTIADKIHEAADSIRRKSESPDAPSPLGNYGKQASSLLDKSAQYVREFDIKKADDQMKAQIRNNPGRSLLIALGAGLLIGIWLKRR